ncbi:MAG: DUF1178 family protein [Alphaproteobacteria bacterium]|nr:DUF1178 family protein [Alphaproteobacteria bacterium]MBV9372059.1 DUF1178 family protein [Alphaproteobacteria bacterium]MBV9901086.1 DUF1178 family protein [Alphaproteobacteria bacterium]
MIIFDLRCAPAGHVFEAWFGSSADYEDQRGRGLVACPVCGSAEVAKAPMAPAVPAKSNAAPASHFSAAPEQVKAMMAAAAAVQKQLLATSESVGERFADEARAIHLGEADRRPIHGRATRAEAESLIDEGIPVAPLLFPVAEPGTEN